MSSESALSFEFRHILISLETGHQSVIALCHGPLAVCMAQSGEWRLSHIATGYMVLAFKWWDDACKAAIRLGGLDWTHAGEAGHPDHALIGAEVRRVFAEVMQESATLMYDPEVDQSEVVPIQ